MNKTGIQALEIILPPGSTSADLQTAIDSIVSEGTIIVSSDMPFTDTVEILHGKDITIQSDTGNEWVLTQTENLENAFINLYGILNLSKIIIDGGQLDYSGIKISGGRLVLNNGAVIQNCHRSGVQGIDGSELIINDGAVIQNCVYNVGGGVCMRYNCSLIMNGGNIVNNSDNGDGGGGVYIDDNCVFTMSGGTISGNNAYVFGGGVALGINVSFTMTGGTISGNNAHDYGGGVAGISYDYSFVMTGGKITGNESTNDGGGIYLGEYCGANISGDSFIAKNTALNGNGGGIYSYDTAYEKLIIGDTVVFSCNSAATAYAPPQGASALYPDIRFASTSITDHPLNNFDINYTGGEPIEPTFRIIYTSNGGVGGHAGPEIESGGTDIVLSLEETGIRRQGFIFNGWNTESDGSGKAYAAGDMMTVNCSTVLFALWGAEPELFNVTYNSNGGTGSHIVPEQYATRYMILSHIQAEISRPGYVFRNWNTTPDGSGTAYMPGDIIVISGDVILYAQWMRIPGIKKLCGKETKCRTSIGGQKLWVDNDNEGNTRPANVEIILLRDGVELKRITLDSFGDGQFGFCCLPVWNKSGQKYRYTVDEVTPDGYIKTIEGRNIINTLTP